MSTVAVFDSNEGHHEHCCTKSTMSGRNKALLLCQETLECTETKYIMVDRLVCGCSRADAGTVRSKPCTYREHQTKAAMQWYLYMWCTECRKAVHTSTWGIATTAAKVCP